MLKCPNCGLKAEITKQWSCRWCGYPLVSPAFVREKERRDADEARRIAKEEAKARKEEARARKAGRVPMEPKQRGDQYAQELEGKLKMEAAQIVKGIMEQETAEKRATGIGTEKHIAESILPAQVSAFQPASRFPESTERIQATDKIKVFIVDKDLISSHGLLVSLSQSCRIDVIGRADYYTEDTILMIKELGTNVVLADIDLPSLGGLTLAKRIIERAHNVSVIMLTPYEEDTQIFRVLKSGAAAYLSKHTAAEELTRAVQRVHNGERVIDSLLIRPGVAQQVLSEFQGAGWGMQDSATSLSPAEAKMLSYFADGYSLKQVAHAMAMTDEAIGNSLASIASKLIASECQPKQSRAS